MAYLCSKECGTAKALVYGRYLSGKDARESHNLADMETPCQ